MGSGVEVKGLKDLERKLRALPKAVEKAVREATKDEITEAAGDLRSGAPVKDGDLRDSVQREINKGGLSGQAAVTARHATYVVNGTSDTPANDFVTPVVQKVRRRFEDRVIDKVNAELRKI